MHGCKRLRVKYSDHIIPLIAINDSEKNPISYSTVSFSINDVCY